MSPTPPPRVLVIEDNPINMELVSDLLEVFGARVEQAETAEDGLEMAFDDPPQLILLDLRLPGMDGHEAVRRLKADPRTASIPTIAVTAQAMRGDEEGVRASGFDDYISKPIDTRAFRTLLASYLPSMDDTA